MPTIAFVSPKGGAGKTTSAFLLATALARFQPVTFIDADPNHPIADWVEGGNAPSNLTVVTAFDEASLVERIEDAASKTPFVIVDLEGTASKIVLYAISRSDLVIIPTQGSLLDSNQAVRAIRVIMQSQERMKNPTPYAVLFTRTSPTIRTRTQTHIQKSFVAAGIPVFATQLNERDAFRAIFAFQQTLDGLSPSDVPNLDQAKNNVWSYVEEVVERITALENGGREEDGSSVVGAA